MSPLVSRCIDIELNSMYIGGELGEEKEKGKKEGNFRTEIEIMEIEINDLKRGALQHSNVKLYQVPPFIPPPPPYLPIRNLIIKE